MVCVMSSSLRASRRSSTSLASRTRDREISTGYAAAVEPPQGLRQALELPGGMRLELAERGRRANRRPCFIIGLSKWLARRAVVLERDDVAAHPPDPS